MLIFIKGESFPVLVIAITSFIIIIAQNVGGDIIWENSAADEAAAVSEEILDHEKCIKQRVLTVEKNVKYHSNQQKENQYIAKIATQKEDQNDTN